MTLTTRITLIGLAAAAVLAWSLGGARGAGTIAGYLAGASVTGFALARQRQVLRTAPQRALQTMVEGFLLNTLGTANQRHIMAAVGLVRAILARHFRLKDDCALVADAQARLDEAAAAMPEPAALDFIGRSFQLSPFERQVRRVAGVDER